jgi:hypothetical protein
MMLDEYPAKPSLIVGDSEGHAAAIIDIASTGGLLDALAVFTLSDSAKVELVMPTRLRPNDGLGAVCPCGGDVSCAGCGGTGVYRGAKDALVVYELTPEGPGRCVAYGATEVELTLVSGFVAQAFGVALAKRKAAVPLPLTLVLGAWEVLQPGKVRRLGEAGH